MPSHNQTGLRIAAAGTAAAALTLAAGTPALAQDGGRYPDDAIAYESGIIGAIAPEGGEWSDYGLSDDGVGAYFTIADVGDTLQGLDAVLLSFNHTQLNELDFEFALEGDGYACTDDGDLLNCQVTPDGGVVTIWFKFSANDEISLGDAWHYWVTASYISDGEIIVDYDDFIVFDEWLLEELGLRDSGEDGDTPGDDGASPSEDSSGGATPTDPPESDEAASPKLPATGASSVILVSAAAGAIGAGAVVFFVLRRRKLAQHWE